MQFIVKRDKLATNGETLIIYDARTLRSFCRIEPDPEGFVIVAKFP